MFDFLYNIDVQLFYFINVTCANPITDKLMPFITDREHWFIFYGIMWLAMVIKGGKRGRIAAIMIIVCVIISDQASSSIIKNLFHRIRPCNVLQGVHLLVGCTDSFSFPSSHAVNYFAGVTMLSYFFKEYRTAFFSISFLVALSRIFVGVHYPSDVLGGILIGIIIGLFVIWLWLLANKILKIDFKKK